MHSLMKTPRACCWTMDSLSCGECVSGPSAPAQGEEEKEGIEGGKKEEVACDVVWCDVVYIGCLCVP